MTDEILIQVLDQLKELTSVVRANNLATCNTKDALGLLGLKDPGHLTYFCEHELLKRRGGRKSGYVYYKPELLALSEKIRQGVIEIPRLKNKSIKKNIKNETK
jgi:hypothetical protein